VGIKRLSPHLARPHTPVALFQQRVRTGTQGSPSSHLPLIWASSPAFPLACGGPKKCVHCSSVAAKVPIILLACRNTQKMSFVPLQTYSYVRITPLPKVAYQGCLPSNVQKKYISLVILERNFQSQGSGFWGCCAFLRISGSYRGSPRTQVWSKISAFSKHSSFFFFSEREGETRRLRWKEWCSRTRLT